MSTNQQGRKGMIPVAILIAILLIAALAMRRCGTEKPVAKHPGSQSSTTSRSTPDNAAPRSTEASASVRGLNRNPSVINYSKHAKCRMACRHITQQEVKDILVRGTINYKKSELNANECQKRYAVEGTTRDRQRVRIIFVPCQTEETVVTVIDLDKEWSCNCD